MKKYIVTFLLAWVLLPISAVYSQSKINLAGEWKFATDATDRGIQEKWFLKTLPETVSLPGSMATNGKGDDITVNTRFTGQIVDSSFYKKPEYAKY